MLIEKLRTLNVIDDEKLVNYVEFCLHNSTEVEKRKTQNHHILPKSAFPEYIDLKEYTELCNVIE